MGHIAHLRSMNTFEQSYYYIYYKIGPILVEIGPVVSEKKIFFNLSMYFCYFVSISSWKIAGPFICSNLNSLHQCMFCTMFGWNWPSGSGEDENVKSSCQQRRQWRQQTMDKFWSEKLTWAFSSGECAKIKLCIVRTVHWTCKCSKLVPISQSLVQWPSHIVYLQTQYDLNSLFLPKKWETVDISPEGRRTYLHQTLWGGQASCSIGTWTHTGCRVGHCLGNQSNHWHFSSLHKCQEREYSHQPSKQYFFKISSEFIKNSYWQPLLGYCLVKTEEDDILSNFGDYLHIPLR